MAERVRITDVSPRDGLQNEPGVIPTAEKVRLVELLSRAGVDEIEVTSCVSPKWVPQLGDGAEVLRAASRIPRIVEDSGVHRPLFSALVPNERGVNAAIEFREAGVPVLEKIALIAAASETFSLKNTNVTIAESMIRQRAVADLSVGFIRRGYVSCVIACPFEGPISPAAVATVAGDLFEMGLEEIDLGDTIGAGTPQTVVAMLDAVLKELPRRLEKPNDCRHLVTLHLHDTFGRAAECVKVALDMGIRSFDASVAGLGGCPYASTPGTRAPGNISTEVLVRTIHDAGYETGVDMDKLAEAARFAREIVTKARAGA